MSHGDPAPQAIRVATPNRAQKAMSRLLGLTLALLLSTMSLAQTPSTGAIAGIITDASGAVVAGATISVTDSTTGEVRKVTTGAGGNYIVPLLTPGPYKVQIEKTGFKTVNATVSVYVTETATVNLKLEVGAAAESVTVIGAGELLKTQDVTLGQVVDEKSMSSLPLTTRNYTQILALSPGVSANAFDAAEIGRGGQGANAGLSSNGSTVTDNNFQMNGVEINDSQQSGFYSGGTPVPNPDSLQEFKVQTSQFDAGSGRNSGANVNIVTKSGTNNWHGSAWEYFRNEALNANSYFRNQTHQPKGEMRQNQYGGTIGGPLVKNKLFVFGSYQGTNQKNGVDSSCSSSVVLPVLTNDRSPAGLAAAVGPATAFGGYDILGRLVTPANVSPQAQALFNYKLPNGQYMIPNPQTIRAGAGGLPEGFSTFSIACPYTEQQFMVNMDYIKSEKSTWQGRFFYSNTTSTQTLPNKGSFGVLPGSPSLNPQNFRNFSLSNTYVISNRIVNQATFGFTRSYASVTPQAGFSYSDIGASVPSFDNSNPLIIAFGGFAVGGFQGVAFGQNAYILQDSLSVTQGKHSFRFGGGVSYQQINDSGFQFPGEIVFINYPGLMLGAAPLNPYLTQDLAGITQRNWREWDANFFVQDDWKITPRLTLNLGFRFERLGDPGEINGRNSTIDFSLLNPNPTATGTLAGYVVSDNYPGTAPAGVVSSGNNLGIQGKGQNTLNPRIGFSWRLPGTERMVLRGGWGFYHQRISGQPFFQQLANQPFSQLRGVVPNLTNGFAAPFPADPGPFPQWSPYTNATLQSPTILDVALRPPILQKYSLGLQTELTKNLVLDVAYAGMRSTHLLTLGDKNQASLASPTNPIRTETTNTLANIQQRVPYQGFSAASMNTITSNGFGWYNALQASLTQRLSHGIQFLASYTWSKNLSNAVNAVNNYTAGGVYGDMHDPWRSYGPDNFTRPQRFVFSGLWELPGPKNLHSFAGQVLGGWQASGVVTIQSGHLLTASNESSIYNIYGAGADFANLVPGCNLNKSGSTTSKLNNWANSDCLAPYPVVGDGVGWGNGGVGNVVGPSQAVTDLAVSKFFPLRREGAKLEFRTEFYNLFNHPIFSDPDLNVTSPGFGTITTTSSNPRMIQFALKLTF
jgi:hypothetical protein